MLLALAILSIVVVMVFQIIQTTLKVTADINFLQLQQRKVDGICELLRRNFVSMPQTCLFQTRKQNGFRRTNLPICALQFFMGKNRCEIRDLRDRKPTATGWPVRAQRSGGIRGMPRIATSMAETERKGDWVPLIKDVDQLSWRFYDARTDKWSSDWPDTAIKPTWWNSLSNLPDGITWNAVFFDGRSLKQGLSEIFSKT